MSFNENNPYSAPEFHRPEGKSTLASALALLFIAIALRLIGVLVVRITFAIFGVSPVSVILGQGLLWVIQSVPAAIWIVAMVMIWRRAPLHMRRIPLLTVGVWLLSVVATMFAPRFLAVASFTTLVLILSVTFSIMQAYCLMSFSTRETTKKWGRLLIGINVVYALVIISRWEFSRNLTPNVVAEIVFAICTSGLTCWLAWQVMREQDGTTVQQTV